MTSEIRERLKRIMERTSRDLKELENKKQLQNQSSQITRNKNTHYAGDGYKENSLRTPSTINARASHSVPTKLLENMSMMRSPLIPEVVEHNLPEQSVATMTCVTPSTFDQNTSNSCNKFAHENARQQYEASNVSRTPCTSNEKLTPQAPKQDMLSKSDSSDANKSCTSTQSNARLKSSNNSSISRPVITTSQCPKEVEKVQDSTAKSNIMDIKSTERDMLRRRASVHVRIMEQPGSSRKEVTVKQHPRSHSSSSFSHDRCIIVRNRSYPIIDLLGRGGSSKVYQVLDRKYKRLLAIKCVDLLEADNDVRNAYINEIKLLKSLSDSGCVVEMLDFELRGNVLYVVMEKGDTDLATFLKTRRSQIDDLFIRFYWSEMLKCVRTIHEKGIVHSDLKPANFLLVGGNLKLIDFGIASAIPTNKTSVIKDTQMGTLSYMPPEAIASSSSSESGNEKYRVRKKADVWALGCILFNMVYGFTPYQMWTNPAQKMHAILHKPIVFGEIEDTDLLDVLKRCLERNPDQRATVEELQNHPYLTRKLHEDNDEFPQNDSYFVEMAEDLRNCTPRTSSRKLRQLILHSGAVSKKIDK
ncbi:unnamed protein product [Thelazia callipaeda]|uniref:Protein kinase domain-containing protein n=1 Tax=Thelazia callipaeda TaxID=103827 RepID=A0A0N5CPD4_THECL|nr:unnamed protein product [Thelazia callipaeda]